jgi:hypothetical protein
MSNWVRYVIAAVVAAHGLVYLNAARGVLPVFEGWKGRSWLFGSAVTGDPLRKLCLGLWALAGVGLIASGIAFAFSVPTVWYPLVIAASVVGILGFLAFWDGRPERLLAQGVIGVVLSAAILAAAIWLPAGLHGGR